MYRLNEFLSGVNDYLKEIILCGVDSLNESDENRINKYINEADNLGLNWIKHTLEKMNNEFNQRDLFILHLCEVREYIKVMKFNILKG
ncbi:MAG: hypothetical protein ACRC2K_08025 [Clostridium sp.]